MLRSPNNTPAKFFLEGVFQNRGRGLGIGWIGACGGICTSRPRHPAHPGGGLLIRWIRADVSANCPIMPIMLTSGFNDINDLADYTPSRLHDAP